MLATVFFRLWFSILYLSFSCFEPTKKSPSCELADKDNFLRRGFFSLEFEEELELEPEPEEELPLLLFEELELEED